MEIKQITYYIQDYVCMHDSFFKSWIKKSILTIAELSDDLLIAARDGGTPDLIGPYVRPIDVLVLAVKVNGDRVVMIM